MNRYSYTHNYEKPSLRWIKPGDIWRFKGGPRKIPTGIRLRYMRWWPDRVIIIAKNKSDVFEARPAVDPEIDIASFNISAETIYKFYE